MSAALPLHDQLANWCVHFNGMLNTHCKVGITYEDVRNPNTTPYGYPCLRDNGCPERCARVQYPTEQEIAEQEEKIHHVVRDFLDQRNT